MLQRLQREERLTLLLISHELSVVYRHATEVLCLSRGRAYLGPPLEILTPDRLHEVYGATAKFHFHDDHAD
jgi:ABC-type Mn2+/Zn2+ transport system ATPase subunit